MDQWEWGNGVDLVDAHQKEKFAGSTFREVKELVLLVQNVDLDVIGDRARFTDLTALSETEVEGSIGEGEDEDTKPGIQVARLVSPSHIQASKGSQADVSHSLIPRYKIGDGKQQCHQGTISDGHGDDYRHQEKGQHSSNDGTEKVEGNQMTDTLTCCPNAKDGQEEDDQGDEKEDGSKQAHQPTVTILPSKGTKVRRYGLLGLVEFAVRVGVIVGHPRNGNGEWSGFVDLDR